MSWAVTAAMGIFTVKGIIDSNAQKDASRKAGEAATEAGEIGSEAAIAAGQASAEAAERGIEEQRRQFDNIQKLLSPFISAGETALGAQQALLGLSGDQAQQEAIANVENSPAFAALVGQGEEAILQNASATGGLRGGNVQGALAQFRPALLSDLMNKQFSNLAGLTDIGQASAVGQATAGQQTGANIANLFGQQGQGLSEAALAGGQAQSGAALGRGQAGINEALAGGTVFRSALEGIGTAAGLGLGPFGKKKV